MLYLPYVGYFWILSAMTDEKDGYYPSRIPIRCHTQTTQTDFDRNSKRCAVTKKDQPKTTEKKAAKIQTDQIYMGYMAAEPPKNSFGDGGSYGGHILPSRFLRYNKMLFCYKVIQ